MNSQTPNSKGISPRGGGGLGVWNLKFDWNLMIGIWSLTLIAALLLAAAAAREKLIAARTEAGLTPAQLADLPPVGAASVVLLGGFRGVAVDVLWLEAITYHERRQYVEERGMVELITEIQPRFVSVWSFWATAIAYDVSVQFENPREQWPWIRDAVQFLRKGIDLNPQTGDLWFYLGWIYQDKMSQNPYFEEACERDLKVNNYEEAARCFDRSRKLSWGPEFPFAPRVVEGGPFWALLLRGEQVLRRASLVGQTFLSADNNVVGPDTSGPHFSPKTLTQAKPYLDNCRREAAALIAKYPKDDIYRTFPARVESAVADGYAAQVTKALEEGDFSDSSIARARAVLDRALSEFATQRARHDEPHIAEMFRLKVNDAWLRIPSSIVRHVDALMSARETGPARALELLRQAKAELDRTPEAVRSASDYAYLLIRCTKGIKALQDVIRQREND